MDLDKILSLVLTYAVPGLIALLILWIGFKIARSIGSKAEGAFNKAPNSDPSLSRFFASLVRYLLMVVVVMAALGVLGIDTSPIFGLIAASGAAMAFVLQGALGNVAAGVMLILFKKSLSPMAKLGAKQLKITQPLAPAVSTETSPLDLIQI